MIKPITSLNSNATSGHRTVEQMVNGFAVQDMDAIMMLFDESAIYQDMAGSGECGKTMYGASAIKSHFSFYFKYLMPSHTYEDAIIVGEGKRICASWTLVLGTSLPPSRQYRVRGCDFFVLEDGKVVEKSAFLKISLSTYFAIARIKLFEAFSLKTTEAKSIQK